MDASQFIVSKGKITIFFTNMQHERTYIFFCWPIYVNLYNPEDVRICKSLDMCRRCVGNFVAYLMNIL